LSLSIRGRRYNSHRMGDALANTAREPHAAGAAAAAREGCLGQDDSVDYEDDPGELLTVKYQVDVDGAGALHVRAVPASPEPSRK
jgi:hypothetical protein